MQKFLPTKAALFKIPFCNNDNDISHSISINGITKPMFSVSTMVAIRQKPDVSKSNAWNFPMPVNLNGLIF